MTFSSQNAPLPFSRSPAAHPGLDDPFNILFFGAPVFCRFPLARGVYRLPGSPIPCTSESDLGPFSSRPDRDRRCDDARVFLFFPRKCMPLDPSPLCASHGVCIFSRLSDQLRLFLKRYTFGSTVAFFWRFPPYKDTFGSLFRCWPAPSLSYD